MNYRQLGRSGLYVSPLALGTLTGWTRGNVDEALITRLYAIAFDAGINLLDCYPATEPRIGKILKERGGRERVIIAAKSSGPTPREPNGFLSTRRQIIETCEASLKRLGTHYIDILQLHCAEPLVPIDETLSALTDLQRSGNWWPCHGNMATVQPPWRWPLCSSIRASALPSSAPAPRGSSGRILRPWPKSCLVRSRRVR